MGTNVGAVSSVGPATSWRVKVPHGGEESTGPHAVAFVVTPLSVVGFTQRAACERIRQAEGLWFTVFTV